MSYTKRDSLVKIRAREALTALLSSAPIDLHTTHANKLSPGQAVTFIEYKGQGVASETHTGYVAHTGQGVVAVHTDKHTFSGNYQRDGKVVSVLRHDPVADKAMIERERKTHDENVRHTRVTRQILTSTGYTMYERKYGDPEPVHPNPRGIKLLQTTDYAKAVALIKERT